MGKARERKRDEGIKLRVVGVGGGRRTRFARGVLNEGSYATPRRVGALCVNTRGIVKLWKIRWRIVKLLDRVFRVFHSSWRSTSGDKRGTMKTENLTHRRPFSNLFELLPGRRVRYPGGGGGRFKLQNNTLEIRRWGGVEGGGTANERKTYSTGGGRFYAILRRRVGWVITGFARIGLHYYPCFSSHPRFRKETRRTVNP